MLLKAFNITNILLLLFFKKLLIKRFFTLKLERRVSITFPLLFTFNIKIRKPKLLKQIKILKMTQSGIFHRPPRLLISISPLPAQLTPILKLGIIIIHLCSPCLITAPLNHYHFLFCLLFPKLLHLPEILIFIRRMNIRIKARLDPPLTALLLLLLLELKLSFSLHAEDGGLGGGWPVERMHERVKNVDLARDLNLNEGVKLTLF